MFNEKMIGTAIALAFMAGIAGHIKYYWNDWTVKKRRLVVAVSSVVGIGLIYYIIRIWHF